MIMRTFVLALCITCVMSFSMMTAQMSLRTAQSSRSAPAVRSMTCTQGVKVVSERVERREAGMIGLAAAWLAATQSASAAAPPAEGATGTLEGGLEYKVVKAAKGAQPKIGDLVAIRFAASFEGKEFDNCFKTANAYYYRVGSESVIKGLDLAVQNMHVGERWNIKIPASLAFGDKGLKPSPGKPRIPGGATIEYDVLLETFPGAEEDLLEVTGGDGV